jgi:diguanylate cyclase (GGDEF)-like protein/PAS domain S-box-containing protein
LSRGPRLKATRARADASHGSHAIRSPSPTDRRSLRLTAAAAATVGASVALRALVRASAESLSAAEERFRRVFEDSPTGMVLADLDLNILDANPAFGRFLGLDPADLVGRSVASYSHPEDMVQILEHHRELLAGTVGHYRMEKRYMRADGSLVWGQLTVSLVRDARGRPHSMHAQIEDISERRRTADSLDRRARQGEDAAELGRIALVAADVGELAQRTAEVVAKRLGVDGCLVNEVTGSELHALAVVGATPGHVPGDRWPMRERSLATLTLAHTGPLVVADLVTDEVDASAALVGSGMRSAMSVAVEGQDGPAAMVAVFTRAPRSFTADEQHFLHVVANVMGSAIERASRETIALHRALHDPLTGLPNRDLFADRLALSLARGRRGALRPAVLIADLDQFKVVNDSLGHQAGDELLRGVAPRLAAAVRETDTVARFGGDEFVVLCDGVVSEAEALKLAQRLAAALEEPLPVAGSPVYVSASFGVALAGPDSDAVNLLSNADAALYRAKSLGRGRCVLFDAPMRAEMTARLELETGLRSAIERDELSMHYQPIVDLRSGRPFGFEALMRWSHPVLGSVPPDDFIPVAEESGLIVALGRWALLEACTYAASMGPDAGPIGVNVSSRQLASSGLVDDVMDALAQSGLPASRLVLELTESALLEEAGSPLPVLHELKARGVSLTLDDFGTGYSSLAYLQRFPLDGLKIDRAFIANMTEDPRAAALVQAVVTMARSLDLTVVPEGIETEAQRKALLAIGCQYGQGYLFGRPQPAAERVAQVAAV